MNIVTAHDYVIRKLSIIESDQNIRSIKVYEYRGCTFFNFCD